MEGYPGRVRPRDSLARTRGGQPLNVNCLTFDLFKEILPAAVRNDRIDTDKILEQS